MCGTITLLDEGWHHFIYQGIDYVNIPNVQDGMIRISIPNIGDTYFLEGRHLETVINETNREVKYVKAVILENGSISLNYDHKIIGKENAEEIVPHMIKALSAASKHILTKLQTR